MVTLGIEKLVESAEIIRGKHVGLIANATSVDRNLTSSVELLHNIKGVELACLFGPQQGFWGETQDNMIEWQSGKYPRHDLLLYSLYSEHRKPTAQMLSGVDALVFDIQDVGTRTYTYIWTMVLAMQSCAEFGKEFIVCDRPNPINGIDVEGNVSSPEFSSFVSLYPLPQRHGMTPGEIAGYVNGEFRIGCDLTVVPLAGWKRQMWHDETGLPWVMPSANLPTPETAAVYPGGVVFEGTNISEGRGTTRPFEFIGAPYVDGFDLADRLSEIDLAGVAFRPCVFIPTFGKYAGKNCGGVQLHVTDRGQFKPVKTALALLKLIREMYPGCFEWAKPPYEYVRDRPPIDVIMGAAWVRDYIESGRTLDEISRRCDEEVRSFMPARKKYLLY